MSAVFSFGELLWDLFPDAKKPGGSPANVAYHLHALGHQSSLITRVGSDPLGEEITRFIREKGLSDRFIQRDETLPTGTVTVSFDADEPSYTIHEPAAWDAIAWTDEMAAAVAKADAVCYASLSQRRERSAATLQQLLKHAPESALRVFDLNLRPPFVDKEQTLANIEQADVIKCNEEEFEQVAEWLGADELPAALLQRHPKMVILQTLGARGSRMYRSEGVFEASAAPIRDGGDFVGVGDAFLACVVHLLLAGEPNDSLLPKANRYAAEVACHRGGMPPVGGVDG
ncbi:MAG: carbohydrate kinase family protein [Balneolaceae bacterium]